MSDFTAKVTAQLDTSKIPSQLSEIQSMAAKQKIKILVDATDVKNINQVTNAFNDLMKLQNRINSTRLKLAGLDSSKDSAQIKELSGQLNRLMADYNNLHSTFSRSFSTNQLDALNRGFETTTNKIAALNAKASDTSGLQKTERAYERLKDIVSQMDKIQLKIGSLDATKNSSEIAQLTSQFTNLNDQYNRLKTSLNGKLSGIQVTELSRGSEELKNKLSQLDAKAQDTQRRLAEAINVKISNGAFESSIAKVTAEYEKLATTGHSKLSEVKNDIESLTHLQQQMKQATNAADLTSNYDKFNSTLQRVKNTLSTVSAESKTFASSLQMTKLDNKMATWLEKNSKAAKDYGATIEKLRSELASLMNSGSPVPVSNVNSIESQFSSVVSSAEAAGKTGATFASRLKGSLSSISSYLSTTTLIYTGIRGLKEMYKNVTNIDSAMVELKKVTDETDDTYNKFLSGTNQRAQKIGTTITGLITSTADFARLGYSFEESEKLAETANIYAVVGDEIADVDTATKSIISTMKAFNVPVEDSISIVDKFNEVGNNFAISSGGIGEAMERSASSMRAANNTIDETIALITAANTVVQNPESVGTAFKTISMRIRGAKTELEDAGLETDGMAESTAKLREEIKALSGVDIMQDENTFKSTYKIMDELAQKWGDLTDIQQASITELIAGKRQGNIVSSLMENFDEARKALDVSMNSEGSAMKEHEKWLDSIEAKVLQLKASWEGLSNDFLSSGFLKSSIDGLRILVNVIDSITSAVGGLGTVLAGAGAALGVRKALGKKTPALISWAFDLAKAHPYILAATVAVAGLAVAGKKLYDAYQYKKHWTNELKDHAQTISEQAERVTELSKLSKEVKGLKLTMQNGSQEEIDAAKKRLEEIARILSEKYNLNIDVNTGDIQKALTLLEKTERRDLINNVEDYNATIDKDSEKYQQSKSNVADYNKQLDAIGKLKTEAGSLQLALKEIDFDFSAKSDVKYDKSVFDKFNALHGNFLSLNGDRELSVLDYTLPDYESYKEILDSGNIEVIATYNQNIKDAYASLSTNLAGLIDKLSTEYSNIDGKLSEDNSLVTEFDDTVKLVSGSLSQVLASDILSGNKANIAQTEQEFTNLGKKLESVGYNTNNVAEEFIAAKQGFTDFDEAVATAIQNGNFGEMVDDFIKFRNEIGADTKETIRNAALIKQGFDDASDVTPKSVSGIFKDMEQLGKDNGISDYTDNALKGTALLAAGFNDVTEATEAGADGINSVLDQIRAIGNEQGLFNDLSDDETVARITEIAHAMGLIPQDCVVRVDDDGSLDGLTMDAENCNDKLIRLEKTDIKFDFKSANLETINNQIDDAQRILDSFKDENGNIDLSVDGAVEAQAVLATLIAQKQQLSEVPAVMNVDCSKVDGELGAALAAVQTFQNQINELEIQTAIGADTTDLQLDIQSQINTINGLSPEIKAALGLNTSDFETAINSITSTDINVDAGVNLDTTALGTIQTTIAGISPEILVKAGVDESLVKGYTPENKEATVTYSCVHTDVDGYNPPNLIRTVTYVKKEEGTVGVDGTAHVDGTAGKAFKSGTWGTKNSGVALGGELGEELVVRNGKFFTIGSESAEMFSYQKGDIIFNAEQTKQIFAKGRITHGNRRGKAFSSGTAFASGSESKENFDWLETFNDRVERSITRFSNKFKSTYLTLTNRFVNLSNALSETNKQLGFKQQAYDRYMAQANTVGLDESWAAKVRNGELDISTVTDDDLKERIKDYKEWYEKALDCKDAIDELHESVADFYTDNFKNIETAYDNILSTIEHKANMLNEYVDRAEEKGLVGSTRYYTALQKVEMENMAQLKYKQTDLVNALNEAINSGEIEVYSEAWYELQGSIDDVAEAIDKSKTALMKFDNQMRQISWDRFDFMQEGLTQLTDESDFLIELLSSGDLYNTTDSEVRDIISLMQGNSSRWHGASATGRDSLEQQNRNYAKRIANITGKNVEIDDDGVWWINNQQLYSLNKDNYGGLSDTGMTILGLHGLNYNTYMEQSKAYANELANIDKQLTESPYDTNLIERRRELLKLQRESILAAEDEKESMIDLIKDGIEEQVDALKDLIDAYIKSLDSAKDLYDYQKKIKNHTKDIASLEKQLAAYQNDASEETKAKIQQIKVELEEARENLQDTEYDKYISDQKELLDNLYDEYESLMNERLDNIDVSIDKLVSEVNNNASTINTTLTKETTKVGTTLSSEMKAVWTSESQALTTYFGDTGIILNGVSGYFENTNTTLSGINTALTSILTGVNSIVQYASFQAKVDIDPEGSKNQMMQNSMDWWATDDENVRSSLAAENEKYGEAFGYTKNDGSWYDSDGNLAYEVTNDDNIRNIVSKMKANSEAWHGASDSKRAELSSANENYAKKIQSLTDQPVYKDGNGVWWIGDRELYAYKSGGLADFTGTAWLDGTPSKPEMVLNAKDTENFIALKDTLKHMSEQGFSLANVGYGNIGVPQLSGLTDISSILHTLRQSNNSSGGNTIGDIEINIPIEHVDDYNDFITQLQKDKQFEKFIRSVSVDLLSGGSTLAKNKYKW